MASFIFVCYVINFDLGFFNVEHILFIVYIVLNLFNISFLKSTRIKTVFRVVKMLVEITPVRNLKKKTVSKDHRHLIHTYLTDRDRTKSIRLSSQFGSYVSIFYRIMYLVEQLSITLITVMNLNRNIGENVQ